VLQAGWIRTAPAGFTPQTISTTGGGGSIILDGLGNNASDTVPTSLGCSMHRRMRWADARAQVRIAFAQRPDLAEAADLLREVEGRLLRKPERKSGQP